MGRARESGVLHDHRLCPGLNRRERAGPAQSQGGASGTVEGLGKSSSCRMSLSLPSVSAADSHDPAAADSTGGERRVNLVRQSAIRSRIIPLLQLSEGRASSRQRSVSPQSAAPIAVHAKCRVPCGRR